MASATGVPDGSNASQQLSREDEPLLGRAGDATQEQGKPLWHNLGSGTAPVAQLGVWLLVGVVWGSVFTKPLILFSAHPLLNSAGLLFITQGILLIQPTHTSTQKKQGAYVHATLNDIGIMLLIAGLVVIEYNKIAHGGTHFESPHAILGLITYCWFFLQALIGFTAFFTPKLYGSVANAKSLYKYHRASGYILVVFALATVATATQTDYNKTTLHIKLWAVIASGLILLVGVLPRLKKSKLGL